MGERKAFYILISKTIWPCLSSAHNSLLLLQFEGGPVWAVEFSNRKCANDIGFENGFWIETWFKYKPVQKAQKLDK